VYEPKQIIPKKLLNLNKNFKEILDQVSSILFYQNAIYTKEKLDFNKLISSYFKEILKQLQKRKESSFNIF